MVVRYQPPLPADQVKVPAEFEYEGGMAPHVSSCLFTCNSFINFILNLQMDHQPQGAGVVVEEEGEGLELHQVSFILQISF